MTATVLQAILGDFSLLGLVQFPEVLLEQWESLELY